MGGADDASAGIAYHTHHSPVAILAMLDGLHHAPALVAHGFAGGLC